MSTIGSNESSCSEESLHIYELVQVQVLTRHGARTPVTNLKINDFPDYEEAIWDVERFGQISELSDIPTQVQSPNGEKPHSKYDQKHFSKGPLKGGMLIGQLTNVGQKESLSVGKKLREKYVSKDFLSSSYNPKEMIVRSSNIERTIMSACCFLVGLYGEENLKEAIKVEILNEEDEYIYPNWFHRKELRDWFQQLNFITTLPHVHEMTIKINKLLGIEDSDKLINLLAIHDIIACREAHGFPIPDLIKPYVEEITESASELFATAVRGFDKNLDILRHAFGDLLEELCKNMENSTEGKGTFKMKLYSAHDTTLMCFLIVVNKWKNDLLPSFAANIVLELYKDQHDEYFINMIYNGEELKFSEDDKYFPLHKFLEMVHSYRSSANLAENGTLD